MKYKNIEIGKKYYVRRWPLGSPREVCVMKVVQKCEEKQVIVDSNDVIVPYITIAKHVLAEVLEKQEGKDK